MAKVPQDVTLLASAARTATTASPGQVNDQGYEGVIVNFNVSAVSGSASLTAKIQGYDAVSNSWYDIVASAAITATGLTTLTCSPRLTAVSNKVANAHLPTTWRAIIVASTSDSCTYSIGAILVGS